MATDAYGKLMSIPGVTHTVDEVRIPQATFRPYMVAIPPVFFVVAALRFNGFIPSWLFFTTAASGLCLFLLFRAVRSYVTVRRGVMVTEMWWGPVLMKKQVIPLESIRVVKRRGLAGSGAGTIVLILTDGGAIRIYPSATVEAANAVCSWLSEEVEKTESLQPNEDPVPVELRRMQRRRSAKESKRE